MSQPSPFIQTDAAGESEEEQFIPLYSTLLGMLYIGGCAVSLYVFVEIVDVDVLASMCVVCFLLSSRLPTSRL